MKVLHDSNSDRNAADSDIPRAKDAKVANLESNFFLPLRALRENFRVSVAAVPR